MDEVYADCKDVNYGKLDYVCAWYKKAVDYVLAAKDAKNTKCAFVSTNSICQGESVAAMWKPLFEMGLEIDFAWRTFRWDNEAQAKAHVHCVIVGFSFNAEAQRRRDAQRDLGLEGSEGLEGTKPPKRSKPPKYSNLQNSKTPSNESNRSVPQSLCASVLKNKKIYDGDKVIEAEHINGYLIDAPDVFIENRGSVLMPGLPKMSKGSQPTDGGNLFLAQEDKDELIAKYPHLDECIRQFSGAEEFINNKMRFCLWLKGVSPKLYRVPEVLKRLEAVAEMRRKSPTKSVQRDAETPMLFTQIRQPETDYLLIPRHSSEKREYIPIGYMNPSVICGDAAQYVPNSSPYVFGVLTSSVHMAWMRTVCGRLKSDYRYTPAVYNNFPWPELGESGFSRVEGESVENVLDRINKIDRSGDDENPDNPVNPVKKTLHVSTRLKNTSTPLRLCVKKTSTNLCDSLRSLRQKIESTAQAILDARALYPDSSLADLYDPLTMPIELRKAHAANDAAVMKAYGYAPTMTEPEIVADLMRRYQELAISR